MKSDPLDLSAAALASAATISGWTAVQWTRLVQQSRMAGLLGRIADQAQHSAARAHAKTVWPSEVQGHFDAALRVCRAQHAEIRREVTFINLALKDFEAPVVLLKGAAYVAAGLPAASGRVFGDVDIMVPKRALAEAESRLMRAGWMTTHQSEYDQRYYRQWAHELPPMQHIHRGTVLDVHHAILPVTARLRPDPARLFEKVVPVAGHRGLHVLCPEDMVLHSMTHLFLNDDVSYALRDLSDLDLLLRHFGQRNSFWADILQRAVELDLTRPLYYGLRHAHRILGTPVPAPAEAESQRFAPGAVLAPVMDAIWWRALRSPHASAAPTLTAAARWALYVRGHWLRMPPLLLAQHLAAKALQRTTSPPE